MGGGLADTAVEAAAARLGLDDELAQRYVARLADPLDGLVADGAVDPAALRTVVDLRRHWLPRVVDGRDVLADALADPGLVVRR